ncbi:hypothetical protein [Streptomyces pratensis]|uniref:hypothetical protein n=1 Tax=Streptomyces pratensis TaxID=1169025 RepID=UPI003016428C
MKTLSRAGVTAAALALLATPGTASAAPAPAASASGIGDCPYPYVCLYHPTTGQKLGQFQDVTSGYQSITRRTYDVTNTRYDDVVYFRHFNSYVCVKPRVNRTSLPATDGIRISWEATCG